MKKTFYYFSVISYITTVAIIGFIFFNLPINQTFIEIFVALISLSNLIIIFKIELEKEPTKYITWKEKSSMDIHEYLECSMPSNEYHKSDNLKLMLMATGIYAFVSFTWVMISSPHGNPVIEHGEYFARNHEILTAISKEKYYELLRINNMLQASFPLVFSMTSIWKLDNYA